MSPSPVFSGLPQVEAGAPPSHDRTETRVLEAVVRLIGESGEGNLTVDEVAASSGVARATVFRRFGSRDAMITAAYKKELHKVLTAVSEASRGAQRADEALAYAFAELVEVTAVHPVVRRLAAAEPDIMVRYWRENEKTGMSIVRSLLRSPVSPKDMGLTPAALDGVCDTLARVLLTCILVPGDATSPWRDHRRRRAVAEEFALVLVAQANRRGADRGTRPPNAVTT